MATTTTMDRLIQYPGVSIRVYGDRSGALFTLPPVGRAESTMRASRNDTARTIRAIRAEMRRLDAERNARYFPKEG